MCRMQGHTITTCPLHMNATYFCGCGRATCTVCPVACKTCNVPGHSEDTQVAKIPKGSRQRTAFVCRQHSMNDMHARLTEIMRKRPLTERQQKEKRKNGKAALSAALSDNGGSLLAAHVTQATLVHEWCLGRAAAGPRARRADAVVAATKDAGATAGGARLAGAMAADQSMHGDRAVTAPPVALSRPSSAGSTVEEERSAALATFDGAFRALQQPKYTPTKRKSMKDVLGAFKVNAARMGSNAEIYGSTNPFSVRTSAQLRTASMRFVNISDVELSSQVRQTINAFFDDPHYFSGCSLTAETVTTDAVMAILSECAVKAGLCNVAALSSVKQFIPELRRAIDNLSAYFSKVSVAPCPESNQRRRDSEEHCDSLTLPHTRARLRRCPAGPAGCDARSILNNVPTVPSKLPIYPCALCPFLSSLMACDISDPTSELPRPEMVGVRGGGGAVGLRSAREHRSTLFGGARRAPGSGADFVEEIVGAGVAGLLESVGRPGM